MPGLGENLKALLSGAPELVQTPAVAVGLAQGVTAPQSGPVDARAVAQTATVAAVHAAAGQEIADQAPTHSAAGLLVGNEAAQQSSDPMLRALGSATTQAQVQAAVDQFTSKSMDGGGFNLNPLHDISKAADEVGSHVVQPVVQHVVAPAAAILNYPEQQVQHYYRTMHDVWTRYGVLDGLEALGTTMALPGIGLVVNGMRFKKSWDVTANGAAYRDVHGNAVNFGYDLANVIDNAAHGHDYMPIGWTRDANGNMISTAADPTAPYKQQLATAPKGIDFFTGAANAGFDVATDPTLKLGKLSNALRASGVVFGGKTIALSEDAATKSQQLADLAAGGAPYQVDAANKVAYVGGRTLVSGREVRPLVNPDGNIAWNVHKLAAQSPAVRDAFGRIAKMNTEQVLNEYPSANMQALAGQLGKTKTIGDVANVFEQAVTYENFSFLDRGLPTTSLTRRIGTKMGVELPSSQAMLNRAGDANIVTKRASTYRPWTIDSRTMRLSGTEADVEDPRSLNAWYSAFMMSQNRKVSNALLAKFIDTPETGEKVAMLTSAFESSIRSIAANRGLTDEEIASLPSMQKYNIKFNTEISNALRRFYGTGEDGKGLYRKDPETGQPLLRGILENQVGKVAFPNWNQVRVDISHALAARDGLDLKALLGNTDDWMNGHVIVPWKSLELLSGGFGVRVSTAELVPAILQNGSKETFGSALMAAAAKLNPSVSELVKEHGGEALKGAKVYTKDGAMSHIADIGGDTATLGNGEAHQLSLLDLLHEPVTEDEVRNTADRVHIAVDPQEVPHYKAAIGKALYGVGRALVDHDYRFMAGANNLTFKGHLMPDAQRADAIDVGATGAGPGEDARAMARSIGVRGANTQLSGDNWVLYDNTRAEMPMFWHFNIHEAAKSPGTRIGSGAFARALDSGASKKEATQAFIKADTDWMKSADPVAEKFRRDMAIDGQRAEELSLLRAHNMRGMVYGSSGKINREILDAISGDGEMPPLAALARKPMALRPVAQKGRELGPAGIPGNIARLTNLGFKKMVDPVINSFSRAPIYTMLSTQEYKFLKPLVKAGQLGEDEAVHIAQVRAANRMMPLIHNVKLRSQMSDLARNLFPFYFAQEQAYRRYGRVILRDPVAFRKMLMGLHGLHSSGLIQNDENGNATVVIPGASIPARLINAGAAAIGLPVLGGVPSVVSGSMVSLRTVVPEGTAPSVSPLVAVPLKEIQKQFPSTEPFIRPIIGDINESQSMTDMLIPNQTIKRVLQAVPLIDRQGAFATTYLNVVAYAYDRSRAVHDQAVAAQQAGNTAKAAALFRKASSIMPGPNDPDALQAALDRMKHTTRTMMMMKAALGLVSPLSPVLDAGNVKLRDEVRTMIAEHGVAQGLQMFHDQHPDATAETVFQSDNSQTGTSIPATKPALDWVDSNLAWIKAHKLAAAYLVPQTPSAFDSQAYNQELAIGLRSKKTDKQLTSALYAASIDPEYYDSLTRYENAYNAAAGNSYAQQQLSSSWQDYKSGLARANPVWAASHGIAPNGASQGNADKVLVATQALSELKQSMASGNTPDSPQVPIAQELIASWDRYQQTVDAINAGLSTASKTDLQDSFNQYLDDTVAATPAATALVTGIFRRLVNA